MDEHENRKPMGQVIQIDEARIRDHLGEMVRGTVEEALNAMLDAEADRLCGAGRYERTEGRKDTRAGSYEHSSANSRAVFQKYRRASLSYFSNLTRLLKSQRESILPVVGCAKEHAALMIDLNRLASTDGLARKTCVMTHSHERVSDG